MQANPPLFDISFPVNPNAKDARRNERRMQKAWNKESGAFKDDMQQKNPTVYFDFFSLRTPKSFSILKQAIFCGHKKIATLSW